MLSRCFFAQEGVFGGFAEGQGDAAGAEIGADESAGRLGVCGPLSGRWRVGG